MSTHKVSAILSMILCAMLISACGEAVSFQDIDGNTKRVQGKAYTLRGKAIKEASLQINGNRVEINQTGNFEVVLPLAVGENKFRVELSSTKGSDRVSKEIIITRDMYPPELEAAKASKHRIVHRGGCDDFAIDNEDKLLAVSKGHTLPKIYDLSSGAVLRELQKPETAMGYREAIAFTPNNNHLLVGQYYQNLIYAYNMADYGFERKIGVGGGQRIAISRKSGIVVTSSNGLWRIDQNSLEITGNYKPNCSIDALAVDSSGKYLASEAGCRTGYEGSINIHNIAMPSNESVNTKIADERVSALSWHSSNEELIAGTKNGYIISCELKGDRQLALKGRAYIGSTIRSLAINPEGNTLLAASDNGIHLLDYPSLQTKMVFEKKGARKVVFGNSQPGNVFYYATGEGVFMATLDGIDWAQIEEYLKLKKQGII